MTDLLALKTGMVYCIMRQFVVAADGDFVNTC